MKFATFLSLNPLIRSRPSVLDSLLSSRHSCSCRPSPSLCHSHQLDQWRFCRTQHFLAVKHTAFQLCAASLCSEWTSKSRTKVSQPLSAVLRLDPLHSAVRDSPRPARCPSPGLGRCGSALRRFNSCLLLFDWLSVCRYAAL